MPLYKSSILIILIISLSSVSIALLMHFKNVQAEEIVFDIAGWIWSDNYGWISLSSNNPQLKDEPLAGPVEYGLELNPDGNKISGWAWSEHVGWICFGSTCGDICGSKEPSSDGWIAKINSNKSITGWAMVVSMCDQGWINLGSDSPIIGNKTGVDCYDCKDVEIYDGEATSTEYRCQTCFTTTKVNNTNIPDDYEGEAAVGGSGNICFTCEDCKTNLVNVLEPSIFRNSCEQCSDCFQYGTAQGSEEEGMAGWAWNGNSAPYESDGAGWVNFSGRAGIVYPWLETIYGSIYTSGNIRQQSFFDHYNATYCLLAKDVFNFNSDKCEQNYNQFDLSFPEDGQSELGLLDVEGLSTIVKTVGETNYNKYGNIIVSSSESSIDGRVVLNNQVYVFNNDLTIDPGFGINNGDSGQKGNGIVIVNGDLIINSSFDYNFCGCTLYDFNCDGTINILDGQKITYYWQNGIKITYEEYNNALNDCSYLGAFLRPYWEENKDNGFVSMLDALSIVYKTQVCDNYSISQSTCPIDSDIVNSSLTLEQTASVAWVVKGDVIIGEGVEKIVGAFIVLGNGAECQYDDNTACTGADYPKYEDNGYGVFFSGKYNKPLTVLGLIVAKAFDFRRTYTSLLQGSERVIYDGRLLVNPPPGLKGFLENLPVIRD